MSRRNETTSTGSLDRLDWFVLLIGAALCLALSGCCPRPHAPVYTCTVWDDDHTILVVSCAACDVGNGYINNSRCTYTEVGAGK